MNEEQRSIGQIQPIRLNQQAQNNLAFSDFKSPATYNNLNNYQNQLGGLDMSKMNAGEMAALNQGYNNLQDIGGVTNSNILEGNAFGDGLSTESAFGGEQGGFGMDQFGAGVNIASNLYGMYAAHEGLGLAKDQLSAQKEAFNYNKDMRNSAKANNLAAYASVV